MSEQGGAEGSGQSQGGEQSTTNGGGDGTAQGGQSQGGAPGTESFDPDRAMATIREQRKVEKDLRDQLGAASARLKEFEDAKLSESERATKRIADLESERDQLTGTIQDMRTRGAIESAAASAGALYPAAVAKLIDRAALTFDKTGEPSNLDAILAETLKQYPAMFGRNGSGDGGPRGDTGAGDGGDMNRLIRRAAGRP